MRRLTEFTFYKNTPFNDLINTIYFEDNDERDSFFNKSYQQFNFLTPFNFIKDRLTLRVPADIKAFQGTNYCRFKSDFDNITYYCFIPEYTYINDGVVEVNLMIDGIMTFCQGFELDKIEGATIKRQHLNNFYYNKYLDYIKNNDDVIKTHTKRYFYKDKVTFDKFNVLIQSNVSLFHDFGTNDNPNIRSATGGTFNGISSPVDLYLTSEDRFSEIMEDLSQYPWITQNFKRIILIPDVLLNKDMGNIKTREVNNSKVNLSGMYKLTGGYTDYFLDSLDDLSLTYNELLEKFGLDEEDQHLLRNEYTTIELYNYSGGELIPDPGKLDNKFGLTLRGIFISGYDNELNVYIQGYKGSRDIDSFINDSLIFKDFDDIPILIDNYSLALAKNAHQRQYAESNLLTNKIGRALNPNNNLQDRLVASVSILSNLSPLSIGQGLIDEHEFYRQQQAQQKDLKLEGPSITEQTTNNSMNRVYDFFGVNLLMSKPSEQELNKIKKYYKLYGYEIEEGNTPLSDTRSMSICNYLQLEGNYYIEGVERSIMETIKIRLENGIRLWHNNNTPNPFTQDILKNRRVT